MSPQRPSGRRFAAFLAALAVAASAFGALVLPRFADADLPASMKAPTAKPSLDRAEARRRPLPEPAHAAARTPRTHAAKRSTLLASVKRRLSCCSAWQSRACLPSRSSRARRGRRDARAGGIFRISFLTSSRGVRPRRPGARVFAGELDAPGHGLRPADALPRQAAAGGLPARARGRGALPDDLARRQDLTFKLRSGFRFSDGQPRPRRAPSRRRSTARWRPGVDSPGYLYTRRSSAPRTSAPGRRRRAAGVMRPRQHAHRPLHARGRATSPPGRRCRSSAPSRRRFRRAAEGVRTFPGAGPYYDQGVPAQRADRDPAQPLLRRQPRAPRRRLRRRPQRRTRPRRCSTGSRPARPTGATRCPAVHLEPSRGLIRKYGLNHSRFFARAGTDRVDVRPQLVPARSSGTTRSCDGPSTSPSTGTRSYAPGLGEPTDQYLPPVVPGFKDARSTRSRATSTAREGAGGREPARRQGRPLRSRRPAGARRRSDLQRPAGGDRARRRDPAVRGARHRLVLPRAARRRRTSRGTWRSCSGRPTSSIPPATSTACSTRSTPAARTWPASTSPRTST